MIAAKLKALLGNEGEENGGGCGLGGGDDDVASDDSLIESEGEEERLPDEVPGLELAIDLALEAHDIVEANILQNNKDVKNGFADVSMDPPPQPPPPPPPPAASSSSASSSTDWKAIIMKKAMTMATQLRTGEDSSGHGSPRLFAPAFSII